VNNLKIEKVHEAGKFGKENQTIKHYAIYAFGYGGFKRSEKEYSWCICAGENTDLSPSTYFFKTLRAYVLSMHADLEIDLHAW